MFLFGEITTHREIAVFIAAASIKKPNLERLGFLYLVEAGGFEPPSASTPSAALHV